MPKIHQLLAAEKTLKSRHNGNIDSTYKNLKKGDLVTGISRTYSPLNDEDTDKLPPESKGVQLKVDVALRDLAKSFTELWDLTATRESANASAKEDVVLPNGEVIITSAPVTFLVWLEKQLTDVATVISHIPVLPPEYDWDFDTTRGHYVTKPTQTRRTKKVTKVLTKAPATDKHPAQTETYQDDEVVGYFETVHFSGGLPKPVIEALSERAIELQTAVKMARAKANETEALPVRVGEEIFKYLLAPLSEVK